MRALVIIVAMLAVLWGGYWFVGAGVLTRGVQAALDERATAGQIAGAADVSVAGFPNRFDLTLTAPRFGDAAGAQWSAPFVQVLALTWQPWHVILALPPTQEIALPDQVLTLTADSLKASVRARPRLALPLERTTLVGEGLTLTSSLGWAFRAATLRAGSQRLDDPLTHDVAAEVLGLGAATGAPVDRARIEAVVTLTAPLDRLASTTPPAVTTVDVRDVSLVWGDAKVAGSGIVTADAAGFAEGRINLRLTGWRAMLASAVAAGFVTPDVAPTWDRALTLLAGMSNDPEAIDLPLVFQRGRASLGPLPLGPAPRLIYLQ